MPITCTTTCQKWTGQPIRLAGSKNPLPLGMGSVNQYVNEHSDQNIQLKDTIHITITEMEDTYNMELTDYIQAYKSEFDLDIEPYAIDVINYYKDVRNMYTLTLNGIMEKLNLQTENNTVSGNIFDELAAQM